MLQVVFILQDWRTEYCPGYLRAYKQGCHILLASQDDVGTALHKVRLESYDDEVMHLAKAANIVRKDIMTMKSSYNGSFRETCQQDCIPRSIFLW